MLDKNDSKIKIDTSLKLNFFLFWQLVWFLGIENYTSGYIIILFLWILVKFQLVEPLCFQFLTPSFYANVKTRQRPILEWAYRTTRVDWKNTFQMNHEFTDSCDHILLIGNPHYSTMVSKQMKYYLYLVFHKVQYLDRFWLYLYK